MGDAIDELEVTMLMFVWLSFRECKFFSDTSAVGQASARDFVTAGDEMYLADEIAYKRLYTLSKPWRCR